MCENLNIGYFFQTLFSNRLEFRFNRMTNGSLARLLEGDLAGEALTGIGVGIVIEASIEFEADQWVVRGLLRSFAGENTETGINCQPSENIYGLRKDMYWSPYSLPKPTRRKKILIWRDQIYVPKKRPKKP